MSSVTHVNRSRVLGCGPSPFLFVFPRSSTVEVAQKVEVGVVGEGLGSKVAVKVGGEVWGGWLVRVFSSRWTACRISSLMSGTSSLVVGGKKPVLVLGCGF